IADETTDVSGIEQFSICIRYVDRFENEEKLREDFLCFVPVEDTTGSGLANVLIDKLKELKLSFAHIRGQGYDGARSMSGHVKGCASVIQNLYPAALYVHCANHSLNLAIATTCKIPAIRNCIGSMKETVNLFRMSTKAGTLLKNLILESFPNSKQVRLLKFCETRWVEHLESLSLFNDLFPLICTALEELDIENLRSDLSKPQALLTAIQSPQFVIAMAILKPIFALSKHISLCLQQIYCDLSSCVAYANNLYAEISEMRKDSEQSFKLIFESVKTIAAELDLKIKFRVWRNGKLIATIMKANRKNITADQFTYRF
ncbi:zinc finger MYM-type protein 1-like, partial [Bactrocera tryoni]|uniref:zinc finger MYM-type protein 1-like n=1 Tax=Bactrocera tryoni TaxID=59916 RepID=UPI001A961681